MRDRLGRRPRTAAETETRLAWLAARTPRYRAGEFAFPFGPVRYVDVPSLRYQYRDIFVNGGYEFRCSRQDPVILDCGANVGLSVIAFKHRHPGARITAFEADPAIAAVLRANLAALALRDVSVVNAAVWMKDGAVPFARDGADSGRVAADPTHVEVPAVRLADRVAERVDMLKLDVEGAEYAVIEDLAVTGTLARIDRIACEVHGRPGDKAGLGRLLTRLAEAGLTFSVASARCAPDLVGAAEATPFAVAPDGKFLLQLYAWRPEAACA